MSYLCLWNLVFDVYVGTRAAAIHDHSNYKSLVGLGEFIAILNGVEFRTRHNDYHLYKPSTENNTYHETEEIEFPEVPKAVSKDFCLI